MNYNKVTLFLSKMFASASINFALITTLSLAVIFIPLSTEAGVDLDLLKKEYPRCENSVFRDACFDDYIHGDDIKIRRAGYFLNNRLWNGYQWQSGLLNTKFVDGTETLLIECALIDGWWNCPTGSKHRALEGAYANASGMQGKFIIHWKDGGIFEGFYVDGVQSGLGEYLHYNGDHYKGNYEHNSRNGFGVYKWTNGNIYEGNWKNGVMHGHGKMTFANGQIEEGTYRNNKFVLQD